MEIVYGSNDSLVRVCNGDKGGPKIVMDIEANRASQWVHPKVLGIVVSPVEHDGRGGVSCIPIWTGAPPTGTCGCLRAGRFGGGDGDGPASGGVPWSRDVPCSNGCNGS